MFEPKIRNDATDLLMQAVLNLDSQEEAYRFFEDVCTIPEIQKIAQRLQVACMISRGENYLEIAEKTGASSATISRVKRALLYGADGYVSALKKLGVDDGRE